MINLSSADLGKRKVFLSLMVGFFITAFVGLVSGAASAQDSLTLTALRPPHENVLNLSAYDNRAISETCELQLLAAPSAADFGGANEIVLKQVTSAAQIIAFRVARKKSRGNPVSFKVKRTCSGNALESSVVEAGLALRGATWAEQSNLLKSKTSVAELGAFAPFPSISFSLPTDVQSDSAGNFYVTEQGGLLKRIEAGSGVLTTALDWTAKTKARSELGLIGIGLHPDFSNNGKLFLRYSDKDTNATVISSFTSSAGSVDPTSEIEILRIAQQEFIHKGGSLVFGKDGYLYIPVGDGGPQGDPKNRGQNGKVLYGKILRIDVDRTRKNKNYVVPASNPRKPGWLPEIWAIGFRNPWKITFDSETNLLWGGDVGLGSYEEVDIIKKGKNYGWRITEGSHCSPMVTDCDTSKYEAPIFDYSHSELGKSVTGGYVYRGEAAPSLKGHYIFGDFANGRIFDLERKGPKKAKVKQILTISDFPSSFGIGPDKELYVLTYAKGKLYKLVPVS